MYLPLFRAIFLSIEIFPISGSIFKFVPNLTVFDTKNASPFWNCASNKPVQNMAVYMGSDIVGEMGFLDDSEIIFGDGRQVRPYVPWNEPRTCSKQDLTTSVTYSWHDPTNWVNAENNSIISNFVHAQKVPSDTDVAVFAGDSSYLVVINLPIRVGLIQANDYNHSSKSFLQHMRSFEGGLEFQFGPSITAEYVWSDLNLITDALTITSRGCNDNRGCLNSNFDKKTYLDVFVNDKGPACSNRLKSQKLYETKFY
uniref:Protein amnionless n=1 Tax=Romanomermis culicivorax TaxID=13658 RepID=A0A915I8C3_ROMCU